MSDELKSISSRELRQVYQSKYCLQIQVSPRQQLLLLRAQSFFNSVVENYPSIQMEKTIKGDFHGLKNVDV